MITSSEYQKLLDIYHKLDNCHDYRMLEHYMEIIYNTNLNCPHPEFAKLLNYAKRRRDYEFNAEYIATVDIDMMNE